MKRLKHSDGWVFHCTTDENADAIFEGGMSCGSFADRPIDFCGTRWIAVKLEHVGEFSEHEYGGRKAIEPHWSRWRSAPGEPWVERFDNDGFPLYRTIPVEFLAETDKGGRVLRDVAEVDDKTRNLLLAASFGELAEDFQLAARSLPGAASPVNVLLP